jgi:hypothetical protein
VLNRFFRFRFSLSAFVTTLAIALASLCYRPDASLLRLLPAIALLFLPAAFFVMASTAAAAHLKINATSAVCAVLAACFLPFAGNYCLSAALSGGGSIPWVYVAVAAVAALPATIAAAIVGTAFTPSQL